MTDTRATVAEAAAQLRAVLDEVDAGELMCSPAFRCRLEGAVITLDTAADGLDARSV